MHLSYDEIIKGNIELHRKEAEFYDTIHAEIWNKSEQKRLWDALRFAACQIEGESLNAMDFGAGTGNITGKLLSLGFEVLAIDISKEMCKALKIKFSRAVKEGKLLILNTNFDGMELQRKFSIVTCYSVLHHLPDYIGTVGKLATHVIDGGVFYIDHEPPQALAKNKKDTIFERLLIIIYYVVNRLLNRLYLRGRLVPQFDYSHADVNPTLDYKCIRQVLERHGFRIIRHQYYYTIETWFNTPLNLFHKIIRGPNSTILVANKPLHSCSSSHKKLTRSVSTQALCARSVNL